MQLKDVDCTACENRFHKEANVVFHAFSPLQPLLTLCSFFFARASADWRALARSLHHSALRGQKKARAGEWGSEMNCTAKTGDQGRSRTLRRNRGLCGTSWSTGLKRAPSCRSSMLLCRREGTSWWKRSGTSMCTSPSMVSKCPRSRLHPVVLAGTGFPWCR